MSTLGKKLVLSQIKDFGFICPGVSDVGGYKRNALYYLSGLLQTYGHLSTEVNNRDLWCYQLWQWFSGRVL